MLAIEIQNIVQLRRLLFNFVLSALAVSVHHGPDDIRSEDEAGDSFGIESFAKVSVLLISLIRVETASAYTTAISVGRNLHTNRKGVDPPLLLHKPKLRLE